MPTRDRLIEILNCYGADPGRWPAEERAAALAVLHRQPDADELLRQAAIVDTGLDGLRSETVGLPPQLEAALAAIPERHAQMPAGYEFPSWLTAWPQLSTLAAAATIAGFILGNSGLLTSTTEVQIDLGAYLYGGQTIVENNS